MGNDTLRTHRSPVMCTLFCYAYIALGRPAQASALAPRSWVNQVRE
ncbi:MAG: hypothetical protein IPK82_37725 [Polyangiaceae bacterium]|nr:hypothetical protein [Polyangiaceae bacterium]